MDPARQVLRFSIPGAVLLLNGMLCFMIYRRVQGVGFDVTSALLRANVEPLVGVLATIPVGFIVYQLYYFNYGPWVGIGLRPWPAKLVRPDRACQVLKCLPPSTVEQLALTFDLPVDLAEAYERVPNPKHWYRNPIKKVMYLLRFLRLKSEWAPTFACGDCVAAYRDRWHANWDILRGMVEIVASLPGADHVKREYITLTDIFHALGAARTAVAVSWFAAILLAFSHIGRIVEEPLYSAIGLILITALSTILWVVLHFARRRTWKSASSSLQFALRWLLQRDPDKFVIVPLDTSSPSRVSLGSA